MKITVGQVKAVSKCGDIEGNAKLLMGILAELGARRLDVVVTPECFLDGYAAASKDVSADDLRRMAVDPATSPHVAAVSAWAAAHACWVVLGCTRISGRDVFNSACVFNRRGELAGCYDKLHCQLHDRVKYTAGRALPVFESDFGVFGVMICADRRWPETVRTLALKGARVIFNPTWGMAGEFNLAMMRTRSYESEVFIVFTHAVESLIAGPDGEVVAQNVADTSWFTVTEIDLSVVDRMRTDSTGTHLRDRRTDVYRL